jgi:hypothetical protein
VIDDFYANHTFFTPAAVRDFQRRAKGINPRLVFLPLMYYGEIRRPFVENYREVIDGVVVAYPQDREDRAQLTLSATGRCRFCDDDGLK